MAASSTKSRDTGKGRLHVYNTQYQLHGAYRGTH
uniref:Uncharacterized protein n=1 Tax=Nelumbo nucifera TaxID=4432 RepID=A0A822Z671_NELNU|nr:TPA_asm: hypothetical protein HUJ06_014443 [Nelumbo nucifera]